MSQLKFKVATCACGQIFMAATLMEAETDSSTCRQFRKYAKEGYRIAYVTAEEVKERWIQNGHNAKTCVNEDAKRQLSLL